MNKNNILLKNHFPVLVAYHESSSNGYSNFFTISKWDSKISKGGKRGNFSLPNLWWDCSFIKVFEAGVIERKA